MSDRELLELAAKAAGLDDAFYEDMRGWGEVRHGFSEAMWSSAHNEKMGTGYWNPLQDDGDAFRLAVKLKLNIAQGDFSVGVNDEAEIDEAALVRNENERAEVLRRAIVRAAAEIGREGK